MDRKILKLYLVIIAAVVLTVICVPGVIGHTSNWLSSTTTHMQLAAASEDIMEKPNGAGCVVFVMDDGFESGYTAGFAVLEKYGYAASVSVIPAAVGQEGYMKYEQLADLYMNGWDMLNHTYSHQALAGLSKDVQSEQIIKGNRWLVSRGFHRGADIVVYPGGLFDKATKEVMLKANMRAGRSLRSLWLAKDKKAVVDAEVYNLLTSTKLADVKEAIDKAVRNKSTLIFVMHKIEDGTDKAQMKISPQLLEETAAYVSQQGDKLSVVTMSSLMER